jgi:hypothetical protein
LARLIRAESEERRFRMTPGMPAMRLQNSPPGTLRTRVSVTADTRADTGLPSMADISPTLSPTSIGIGTPRTSAASR